MSRRGHLARLAARAVQPGTGLRPRARHPYEQPAVGVVPGSGRLDVPDPVSAPAQVAASTEDPDVGTATSNAHVGGAAPARATAARVATQGAEPSERGGTSTLLPPAGPAVPVAPVTADTEPSGPAGRVGLDFPPGLHGSPGPVQLDSTGDGAPTVVTPAITLRTRHELTQVVGPWLPANATAGEKAPSGRAALSVTGPAATSSPDPTDADRGRPLGSWPGPLSPAIPAGDLPRLSPLAGPRDDKRPEVSVSIGRIEVVPPPEPKPPPTPAPLGKAAMAPDLTEYLRSRSGG